MTMTTEEHLSDAEVVGVADAQLEDDAHARADAHLAACAICTERLQRLRVRQQRLSALLRETDFEIPDASPPLANVTDIATARHRREARSWLTSRPAWLRIAAAIVLLVTATFAIPPVQAAVVEWLRSQWSRITREPTLTTTTPEPESTADGMHIEFEHRGSEFLIELSAPQPSGTITIIRGERPVVIADADRPGSEPVVQPTGLRIVNTAAADASYQVTTPPSVTTVTVVVAGEAVARLTAQQLIEGVRLPVR